MINSMTGFAAAESIGEQFGVGVEIRSYNSRHLDVVVRGLQGYSSLEDRIKSAVSDRLDRGRIEIKVQVVEGKAAAVVFDIDRQKAAGFMDAAALIQREFGVDGPVSLELLIGAGGVLKAVQTEMDPEAVWLSLKDCLGEALDSLDRMRAREGAYIAEDLQQRLDCVEQLLAQIGAETDGLLAHYQKRLKERLAVLIRDSIALDEARVAQEAAFLADRSDISEEIVRTGSHVAQFRRYMGAPEACGRKLNFLLQELNRELNTMGAKVGNAAASHLIVEVKSELEKIREQIQNIE